MGLLLLDVDGPLNPYAARQTARPPGYVTYRLTPGGGWYTGREARRRKGMRVWLHPGHGELLRTLAAETGLELVWATTWQHEANTLIGPAIGLDPLPVIEFPPADLEPVGMAYRWRRDGGWKWPAVAAFAGEQPLAWLDDEFNDTTFAAARATFDHERQGCPTLLCQVDPRGGLRTGHADRIRAWATGLAVG